MVALEVSIAILNHIADSGLVLLNNCGHWPPFKKPAEWAAQVLAFLRATERDGRVKTQSARSFAIRELGAATARWQTRQPLLEWLGRNRTKEPSMAQLSGAAAKLDALKWRCIGPPRGGRVVAVAGDPEDRGVFYFGACAGGVWKTVDGGIYWRCVSDGFLGSASIGALALAPSDPNVIYAGTGETEIRLDVSYGDGIYKSTDAGGHLEPSGPPRVEVRRPHPHPSPRPGSRLCRGTRRRLRCQRGTRGLPFARRRKDLEQSAVSRRQYRCRRSGYGSAQSWRRNSAPGQRLRATSVKKWPGIPSR